MVRFLIDANLPRSTADLIRSRGFEAVDVCDIGLGSAEDEAIAARARAERLCLLTRDTDFGNILLCPPEEYAGIVVLEAPAHAGRTLVLKLVESFLKDAHVLQRLPGHQAVVDVSSIRLRTT